MDTVLEKAEQKKIRAFISYSSKDKKFADKLSDELDALGVSVFRPDFAIVPGEIWSEKIEDALNKSDVFIPVISVNTERSLWSDAEIAMAVAGKRDSNLKSIIPILLEVEAKMPPFLDEIQYVDFSDISRFEDQVRKLVNAITNLQQGEQIPLEQRLPANLKLIEMARITRKIAETKLIEERLNRSTELLHHFAILFVFLLLTAVIAVSYIALRGRDLSPNIRELLSVLVPLVSSILGYLFGRRSASDSVSEKRRNEQE